MAGSIPKNNEHFVASKINTNKVFLETILSNKNDNGA